VRETAERIADGMWLKRTWYDADRVRSETVVADRNGAPSAAVCGPHRDFDLDGRLVREVLIAPGSMPLSIDEYEEARRADPRLPPPTVPPPPPEAYDAFVVAQKSDPRYTAIRRDESDRFCTERLSGGAVALAALLGRGVPVMIGERSRRQSAAILEKIRALPCKAVHAVDVESAALPGKPVVLSVESFVLELPDAPAERRVVRRTVGPWARATGYDVEEDLGQRFMFVRIK